VDKIGAPETFALFLAFFIPGFVMSTVWGLMVPSDRTDFSKDLPRMIGYSVLHYAGTLWLVFVIPPGVPRLIAAYVVVLVVPALWPLLLVTVRDRERWTSRITSGDLLNDLIKSSPRPWDDVLESFDASGGCWVRIRLKSGTWIGGALGKGSRYSTYPDDEQLYLCEEIEFNEAGDALDFVKHTKGVFVAGSEIEFMEFMR